MHKQTVGNERGSGDGYLNLNKVFQASLTEPTHHSLSLFTPDLGIVDEVEDIVGRPHVGYGRSFDQHSLRAATAVDHGVRLTRGTHNRGTTRQ